MYKIYCFFTIIRLKQREKITFNIFVLIPVYYFFVLSNSHGNLLFLCFLGNLIHTHTETSKIQIFFGEIFNSHENTACFVFMVIFMDS